MGFSKTSFTRPEQFLRRHWWKEVPSPHRTPRYTASKSQQSLLRTRQKHLTLRDNPGAFTFIIPEEPFENGAVTLAEILVPLQISVRHRCGITVAPVAYQVILEPGIGQFREFEPRGVHTRINSLGIFLVHQLTCGKRESVS